MRGNARSAILVLLGTTSACTLLTSLDDFAGRGPIDAGADATPPPVIAEDAGGDAAPDATPDAGVAYGFASPVVLAAKQPHPRGIVTDDTSVYFAIEDSNAIGGE